MLFIVAGPLVFDSKTPLTKEPVVEPVLIVTELAMKLGVTFRLVPTKESELKVSVWVVVTVPEKPRPVKVAKPLLSVVAVAEGTLDPFRVSTPVGADTVTTVPPVARLVFPLAYRSSI